MDDVVTQVNGQSINVRGLHVMQTADMAMSELLQSPPSGGDVLDRLVNGELVWQAAQAAGFALGEEQTEQQLQDFLATRGKSLAELESALVANGLNLDDFRAYFGRLLVVDQFSRTQAQNQSITVSEYLRQLQREARISFGPAAQIALAQPTSLPPATPLASQVTPTSAAQEEISEPETLAVPDTPTPVPADVPRGTGQGQYAPLFDLPVLNYPAGDFLTLGDLAGKPTLLSFWTTWCPYCRRQTPVLVEAHARYADGVQFVGINVKEDQRKVQEYITSSSMQYPVALDFNGQVASSYGVSGFPTTYFLDAEGRVVARHVGQLSPDKIALYLQRLLETGGS